MRLLLNRIVKVIGLSFFGESELKQEDGLSVSRACFGEYIFTSRFKTELLLSRRDRIKVMIPKAN